ncbi:hypothetical protein PYCCODRAFT_546257 [Trametes coccinea BRFM310]|uniref:Uncharacterized protein n=1 Tax=Trametes coccinea (strain BRFM310) TaxID=1353009 RepID=A0A1Y2IIX0_TRAC3|nr:hypothetical protein PYCCODRAFT_546257 [Trametes coccinea BRFM310]
MPSIDKLALDADAKTSSCPLHGRHLHSTRSLRPCKDRWYVVCGCTEAIGVWEDAWEDWEERAEGGKRDLLRLIYCGGQNETQMRGGTATWGVLLVRTGGRQETIKGEGGVAEEAACSETVLDVVDSELGVYVHTMQRMWSTYLDSNTSSGHGHHGRGTPSPVPPMVCTCELLKHAAAPHHRPLTPPPPPFLLSSSLHPPALSSRLCPVSHNTALRPLPPTGHPPRLPIPPSSPASLSIHFPPPAVLAVSPMQRGA